MILKNAPIFKFLMFFLFSFISLLSADWQTELKHKVQQNVPPHWMLEQIAEDLAPFAKSGISIRMLDQIMINQELPLETFARFKIVNNHISLEKNNITNQILINRSVQILNTLNSLKNCIKLPDVDFIVSTYDSMDSPPYLTNEFSSKHFSPILVFSKDTSKGEKQVLIPDDGALEGYDRLLEEVQKANHSYPWEKKLKMGFWRGAMTGGLFKSNNFLTFPRSKLVYISLTNPSLVDAKYNVITQAENPDEIKKLFAPFFAPTVPVKDHIKYKYQILLDGNTCAWTRAYWQLFSNCVIFKQDSNNIQWYYRALRPYIHYIPLNNDMSDLVEKIEWAKIHDGEAYQISLNAQEFARKNLNHSDVLYYFYLLLNEYAKLQVP